MRRFLQLNPYDFARFLAEQGCVLGQSTGAIQTVFQRHAPNVVVFVQMGEPLQAHVIQAHLKALDISEDRLERYLRGRRRPPEP